LQDVLRKLFVEFIKQTMASSYYSVSLHRGALRQLANTLRSYQRQPGEEDAMINDFGSAVLPELTDIPRLEPQGEWLPKPIQDMFSSTLCTNDQVGSTRGLCGTAGRHAQTSAP